MHLPQAYGPCFAHVLMKAFGLLLDCGMQAHPCTHWAWVAALSLPCIAFCVTFLRLRRCLAFAFLFRHYPHPSDPSCHWFAKGRHVLISSQKLHGQKLKQHLPQSLLQARQEQCHACGKCMWSLAAHSCCAPARATCIDMSLASVLLMHEPQHILRRKVDLKEESSIGQAPGH